MAHVEGNAGQLVVRRLQRQLADLRADLEHLNTAEQSTHDVLDTSTSNTGDSA